MARRLTYSDRINIWIRLNDGWKITKIAKEMKRAPSTICEEIGRNSVDGFYDPNFAQHLANQRLIYKTLGRTKATPQMIDEMLVNPDN